MTVGELKDCLRSFSDETPVILHRSVIYQKDDIYTYCFEPLLVLSPELYKVNQKDMSISVWEEDQDYTEIDNTEYEPVCCLW